MKEKKQQHGDKVADLYLLPDSWEWATVEDAGAFQKNAIVDGPFGSNLKVSDYVDDGPVPVLTTKNLDGHYEDVRYITKNKFEELKRSAVYGNDILMAKIGSCGRTGIYPSHMPPAMIPANLLKVTVNEYIVLKYIYHYFNSGFFQDTLKTITKATAQPAFGITDFKTLPLPFAPRNEQQRIVAEIEKQCSRLDEAVANLNRVKANLKRYKASVLKAAVEGKLTEHWRNEHRDVEPADKLLKRILAERYQKWKEAKLAKMRENRIEPIDDKWKQKYQEPPELKDEETYDIPDTWVWSNLGQLAWSVKDGPHYSPQYSETGVPFITGGNVRPEGIDFSTAKYISEELLSELAKRCKPEYGDILYTKGGTTGIARVNVEIREFGVWVHVAVLKLVDSIDRFYLQHALNSQFCYRQSQRYTHGVGNQDLGLTRMIWITVPLPSLIEQKEIVTEIEHRLSIGHEVQKTVDADIRRAERLRQSILRKAFSGKLVPQEPNDEPAKELLARIRIGRVKHKIELKRENKREKQSMKTPGEPLDGKKRDLIEVLKEANRSLKPEDVLDRN